MKPLHFFVLSLSLSLLMPTACADSDTDDGGSADILDSEELCQWLQDCGDSPEFFESCVEYYGCAITSAPPLAELYARCVEIECTRPSKTEANSCAREINAEIMQDHSDTVEDACGGKDGEGGIVDP